MNTAKGCPWKTIALVPTVLLLAVGAQDPKVAPTAERAVAAAQAAALSAKWAFEATEKATNAAHVVAAQMEAVTQNAKLTEWVAGADWRLAEPWCSKWAMEAEAWASAENEKARAERRAKAATRSQFGEEPAEEVEPDSERVEELARVARRMAEALAKAPTSEAAAKQAVSNASYYDWELYGVRRPESSEEHAARLLREAEASAWVATASAAAARAAEAKARQARNPDDLTLPAASAKWEALAKWANAPEKGRDAREAARAAADTANEAEAANASARTALDEAKARIPQAKASVKEAKQRLDEATSAYEKEQNTSRRPALARRMSEAQSNWAKAVENVRDEEEAVGEADQQFASTNAALAIAKAQAESTKTAATAAVRAFTDLQVDAKKALAAEAKAIELVRAAAADQVVKWNAEAGVMAKAAAKWEAEAKAIARAKGSE